MRHFRLIFSEYLRLPAQVRVLCFGSFVNRAGSMALPFMTIYIAKGLGYGPRLATFVLGAVGVGSLGAGLIGGHLADVVGRKRVMLGSLTLGAAVLLLFMTLRDPMAILLAGAAFGLIYEMFRPAASALLADLTTPEQRPSGYALMYVADNLGFSFGLWMGGILASYSYNWLFVGDALTSVLYATIVLVTIRETLIRKADSLVRESGAPAREGEVGHGETSEGEAPAEPSSGEVAGSTRNAIPLADALARIIRDRTFILFCAATFCFGVVYMQSVSVMSLHLKDIGFSERDYGNLIALNGIQIVLLQFPVTAFLRRFSRGWVIVSATLVTAVGFGLMAAARNIPEFAGTVVIWTFGEIMHASVALAIVSELAPPALRGRYMGVFFMTWALARTLGYPVGGQVFAAWGADAVWFGCCGLALVAAALYATIQSHLTRQTPGPSPP